MRKNFGLKYQKKIYRAKNFSKTKYLTENSCGMFLGQNFSGKKIRDQNFKSKWKQKLRPKFFWEKAPNSEITVSKILVLYRNYRKSRKFEKKSLDQKNFIVIYGQKLVDANFLPSLILWLRQKNPNVATEKEKNNH